MKLVVAMLINQNNCYSNNLYGAIDIGTNNCRMLIGQKVDSGFLKIDSFSRIVRLGDGLDSTGLLSDKAIERTISVLKVCVQRLESHSVKNLRAVATAACRRASNVKKFLRCVENSTGIKIEVISPQEEARLAYLSCRSLVSKSHINTLIIDIGGGSTELLWVDPSSLNLKSWISLDIGVVTLTERYSGELFSFNKMVEESSNAAHEFIIENAVNKLSEGSEIQVIGTSGTATTIASIFLGLKQEMPLEELRCHYLVCLVEQWHFY